MKTLVEKKKDKLESKIKRAKEMVKTHWDMPLRGTRIVRINGVIQKFRLIW